MGIPRHRPAVMRWQSTLENMIEAGTRAIRSCDCGWWEKVDLGEMVRLLGRDGSLWDRRPMCERCDKLTHFMCSPAESTPFRVMISPGYLSMDDLPPQAWMGGWTGTGDRW